jgi:hypothetical protein
MHLRDAWNGAIGTNAETRFEHQGIVLTVPASFDEDARELTVEAARRAGLSSTRRARAKSRLSPPSKRCSPMAVRSKCNSPLPYASDSATT